MLPFWTSFLLRVYALEGIIRDNGFLNTVLLQLGLISHPLHIMRTSLAVYLGIIYSYLPFMVLPLFATLEKLDPTLLEAAADLGSTPRRAFLDVTLPLSVPGRDRRLDAGVHPGGGRVCDSVAARRPEQPHDRPRAVG